MSLGILGTGKTGAKVKELRPDAVEFNSKKRPTLEALKSLDALIVFVPGKVFLEYYDLIMRSEVPTVIASTGMNFPENTHEQLLKRDVTWVRSNNFSIGMNIVRKMLMEFGAISDYIEGKFSIHDIHHKAKLDAPSGTALSMEKWLGKGAAFSSERFDDVIGEHQVTFESEFETINLSHRAKDRAVFAKGALWCAESLLKNTLSPGLWDFFDYLEKERNGTH